MVSVAAAVNFGGGNTAVVVEPAKEDAAGGAPSTKVKANQAAKAKEAENLNILGQVLLKF